MKAWGTIRRDNQICKSVTVEFAGIARNDVDDWGEIIGAVCHELDLARPVLLKKHLKDLTEFSRAVFKADDFMESIDFDKFEIEIFYEKKKK